MHAAAEVAHDDVLAHAGLDEPMALEQEGRVRQPRAGTGATDERAAVGLLVEHRQRFDGDAVDAQLPAGKQPGVVDEQPLDTAGDDVPGRV